MSRRRDPVTWVERACWIFYVVTAAYLTAHMVAAIIRGSL